MNNDCVEAVTRELDALGLKYQIVPAGKHQKIFWSVDKGGIPIPRQYTLPITPSDHRAALNCRSEVRRMLKADGALVDNSEEKEIDQKQMNRHLFKKIKKIEAEREAERAENTKALQKMQSDIEGLVALLGAAPQPAFDAKKNLEEVRREVLDPDHHIDPHLLALAEGVLAPAVRTADGLKVYWDEPRNERALIAKGTDWDELEAECARNPRLPPRPGYRVLPERYARVNKTKNNPEADPSVVTKNPASLRRYEKVRKDMAYKARRRNFSPEGLAKVRENIAKGRAARLAKLAAKKALAGQA